MDISTYDFDYVEWIFLVALFIALVIFCFYLQLYVKVYMRSDIDFYTFFCFVFVIIAFVIGIILKMTALIETEKRGWSLT